MNSDDPWVRRLAEIVELATDHLGRNDKLEDLIEEWENDVAESNRAIEYAQEETEEVKEKLHELSVTYKALKYDRDPSYQEKEINHLKAELVDMSESEQQAKNKVRHLENKLAILEKEHNELQSKWNTWKVVAT